MINITPFQTMKEQLDGEKEERLANGNQRLTFGIPFLDDSLVGIFKNDLILLAGRSGQGKSEIALHISLTNAIAGKRVYHLALEAESREIARRMLFKKISKAFYLERDRPDEKPSYIRWYAGLQEHLLAKYCERATEELNAYDNLKVFYRGPEFGNKELHRIFSSVKNEADLLVLDHLHYMDFSDDNENRAHKEAVKEIRNLALSYNIPVILVAHIRKGDRRNPTPVPDMEDVHGSSDIFKIATKAIMIAPCRDAVDVPAPEKSYRFPTYFRIAKCRQDGSLPWFIGLSAFDITRGEYEEKYIIGEIVKDEFKPLANKPHWAKGAN